MCVQADCKNARKEKSYINAAPEIKCDASSKYGARGAVWNTATDKQLEEGEKTVEEKV